MGDTASVRPAAVATRKHGGSVRCNMRSRGAERSTQLDRDKSDGYVFPVRDLSGAGTSGQDAPPRSRTSDARNRPGGLLEFATLLAACGVGLLLRSLEFHTVFPENGDVLLGLDDAQFHARRALFSFVNFPAVLDFDWYLAFPDGAPAPVPPFFDWATAGVALYLGGVLGIAHSGVVGEISAKGALRREKIVKHAWIDSGRRSVKMVNGPPPGEGARESRNRPGRV